MDIIDAVKVCLARLKRRVSMAELSRILIYGGAGASNGSRSPEWKIAQSISYHVTSGVLSRHGDEIGLRDWDKPEADEAVRSLFRRTASRAPSYMRGNRSVGTL